ncbi:bifunctional phosphoribosylaminoimidazolecarboxamide formyltransferase/IMP cyclohydrolase [Vagococcus carniphilus]|uniref:bifunctional phosphoribosylaminoimidazolecarboxamide formyltransferase/IMP cyclohydrolase n=1 Tax=Vagococcus carniphilus TaxID=218144 RepID=UPI003B58BB59
MTIKRALISVSEKHGVIDFARNLQALNIEIISTGGTQKVLTEAGIKTLSIDSVTGFPEILDGRVKTLHPKIHGGLLGKTELTSHLEMMAEHEIKPIDLICVNLYPFKETLMKENVTSSEIIENIDIGGPSMLRSGSKNFERVTVVVDSTDYDSVIDEIKKNGNTTLNLRKKLAAKAFRHTASYDATIADYLTKEAQEETIETLIRSYELKQTLRYGENNHQKAQFYRSNFPSNYSLVNADQKHGKELSFNNIRDADACLKILREYQESTAVAVKHMNPCGIGSGRDINEAFQKAYEGDPISIFGGILALNQEVDLELAEKLSKLFLEIIIAPKFSKDAFSLLSQKKNLRLLELQMKDDDIETELEYQSVLGGILVQEIDSIKEDETSWKVVTKRQPSEEELYALRFAYKAVKHVKSNGIVIANNQQTVGIGVGQMNRVGSVQIALNQAKDKLEGAVLASDAFFPMADSLEILGESGIRAVIQPGGSIKDQESIDMANKYGMTMIFTGVRHFKH